MVYCLVYYTGLASKKVFHQDGSLNRELNWLKSSLLDIKCIIFVFTLVKTK